MPCIRITKVLVLTAVLAVSSLAWAQSQAVPGDWPQWRGPDRTGVSAETGLLKEWPKDGPKLLWKATGLGRGYSTPSLSKGRIYLIGGKNDNTEEFLTALDARDGKQIWSTKIGAVGPNTKAPYPGTRSTPTVDGESVFALGSDGDLVCAGTADGKVHWRKQLRKDFGGRPGFWAYAESPLVDGDVLFCTPGGAKATLVALNKKTGDLVWKTEVPTDNEAPYSSAIVVETNGVKQYVQYISGGVVGVDAKTGKLLWKFDKSYVMNIPTPIYDNGFVFVAAQGGTPNAEVLLKLTVDGMKATATEVYGNNDLNNHHGGIVKVGDYLYGTNANSLVCMDFKTGKVVWQDRSVGKGSITAADGHLYVRGERGPVALVEATPAGYKEKGRFDPPYREESQEKPTQAWAHPVVAGGRLYLRDGDIMLCYDIKAP